MYEDHPYQCCWRQAGTRQTFGRKRRKCRIHVHRPKPYGNVSRLGKVIYDIVMNILPLCECLWEWWPLYLESNLRGEKSFLHIGDLATEEGSQRKAGRRWLLGTTSAPLCTPDPPKIGLCHLSIRAPGSRLSSTNPALKSGDDCHWAKRIFQWSLCDVPSQSWMPILSSSSWSLTSYKEW